MKSKVVLKNVIVPAHFKVHVYVFCFDIFLLPEHLLQSSAYYLVSAYLPLRLDPRGGRQTGSGKPSVDEG